jgi:ribonuclease Z
MNYLSLTYWNGSFRSPFAHLSLIGSSRAAWHTSFVIPQLNLLLDAGLVVSHSRPRHIFLLHGHSDHTLLAPGFVHRGDADPPDIFCPAELAAALGEFLDAKTMLDKGGLTRREDVTVEKGRVGLGTHVMHGMKPGETIELRRKKGWSATAFACDHSVPCLGYVFSLTNMHIRPEFAGLPGQEIKALREQGVEITTPTVQPIFAFFGGYDCDDLGRRTAMAC